jgi:hypothetical protein
VKLWNGATQNTIGGTGGMNTRNVISGNSGIGVYLTGAGVTANFIQGDYIGVGADGTTALGNAADGVDIERCANNTVGGAANGAGNVIADNGFTNNGGYGVELGLANKSGWQNDLGNNNQWVNNTHN